MGAVPHETGLHETQALFNFDGHSRDCFSKQENSFVNQTIVSIVIVCIIICLLPKAAHDSAYSSLEFYSVATCVRFKGQKENAEQLNCCRSANLKRLRDLFKGFPAASH